MSTFNLTLDLKDHEYPENPMAQRSFVTQMLGVAAQAIGSGYVDPRVKTGKDGVPSDHDSVCHGKGDIVVGGAKIGSWKFVG